jgi:hypothetical protein
MRLLPEWKTIVKRAWSFRFTALGALLAGIELALPLFSDVFHRGVFLGLSIVVSVVGAILRLVSQPEMHQEPCAERRDGP